VGTRKKARQRAASQRAGQQRRRVPGIEATLDAAQERVCRREVLAVGKEERDVDGDPGEDGLLDCREAFPRAGDLDEEVRSSSATVQIFGGRGVTKGVAADNVAFVAEHEREVAEVLQSLGVETQQ